MLRSRSAWESGELQFTDLLLPPSQSLVLYSLAFIRKADLSYIIPLCLGQRGLHKQGNSVQMFPDYISTMKPATVVSSIAPLSLFFSGARSQGAGCFSSATTAGSRDTGRSMPKTAIQDQSRPCSHSVTFIMSGIPFMVYGGASLCASGSDSLTYSLPPGSAVPLYMRLPGQSESDPDYMVRHKDMRWTADHSVLLTRRSQLTRTPS